MLLNRILERTMGYSSYEDVMKDVNLRGWAKQTHVKVAGDARSLLEANHVQKANTLYTLLFEDIKPLESEARMKKFKEEFARRLETVLTGKVE